MTFINIGDETAPGDMIREVPYETRRRATTVDAPDYTLTENVQWAVDKIKSQATQITKLEVLVATQSELLALLGDENNALKREIVALTQKVAK